MRIGNGSHRTLRNVTQTKGFHFHVGVSDQVKLVGLNRLYSALRAKNYFFFFWTALTFLPLGFFRCFKGCTDRGNI